MSEKKFTVDLSYEKDTPGTYVFSADDKRSSPIRSLYITKTNAADFNRASKIRVTVEVIEE